MSAPFPANLKYTKDHEWISFEKKHASIGITEHAIEQLGDIVHLELPEVGEEFEAGSTFGTIESTKTVSDLFMPVSGKIVEVNEGLLTDFDPLSEDPYDNGWIVRVAVESQEKSDELMDAKAYQAYIAEQDT